MGGLRVMVIGGLLVCLLALAALANAGGFGEPHVQVAKHKDGPWRHERDVHIAQGDAKTLYLRVTNTTDPPDAQDATLRGFFFPAPTTDYQVSWHRRGNDISHDVQTSGYDFRLRPDHRPRFRLEVTATAATPQCLVGSVHASPGGGSGQGQFGINGTCSGG